ncbi:o-succinylbenzoate--CoA ligase [Mannheimia haemolytica]|nr:o-succinylbenzoate--CoA ligase [Mannheimia haemolytica]STY62917.1 2-succinylbenzoate--CoA ligase [Mannheimia haemolytica]
MLINSTRFPTQFWAAHSAQNLAIIWEKGTSDYLNHLPSNITWHSLNQLISQAIFVLQQQGATPHSLIAYCGSHRLIGLLTYCASLALGAKILMLNPAQTASQRQAVLDDNGVDLIINDADFAKFSAKTTACNAFFPTIDFEKPATLTLTSGSSGKPKAVVHSIAAHLYSAEGVCELMAFEQSNTWLLSLPLFHVSGQGIIWRWLFKGATLYIYEDKSDFFLSAQKASHLSLVPTQLQRYLSQLDSVVSQKCLLGGSMLPAELIAQAQQSGMTTFSGYGMTEMASTICAIENDLNSVGFPLKHRELKLENGEIWVKGKSLGLGYWQKNGEIRPLVNEQGWFATNDRGEWNSKKQLVIKGRLDNMFISGGENIQPEEIEQLIFRSELVKQVFVLPVNDREFGQRPVAVLAFKQTEAKHNINQLKNWLSDKLEKFKQPIAYYLLDIEQYQQQGAIKISRTQLQQDLNNNLLKEIYV